MSDESSPLPITHITPVILTPFEGTRKLPPYRGGAFLPPLQDPSIGPYPVVFELFFVPVPNYLLENPRVTIRCPDYPEYEFKVEWRIPFPESSFGSDPEPSDDPPPDGGGQGTVDPYPTGKPVVVVVTYEPPGDPVG